jgi:hypothetical protein
MTDHDHLATVDAALDEPVRVLDYAVAPGLALELTYDGGGLLLATWRIGESWVVVEPGEA